MFRSIFDAIEEHDLPRVHQLIEAGADPNARFGDADPPGTPASWTPLHAAVGELDDGGSLDLVVLLLRAGARPDGVIEVTERHAAGGVQRIITPLLVALAKGHGEAARLLLAAGANPDVIDDDGAWPLGYAMAADDWNLVALLLRCGALLTIDRWGKAGDGLTLLGTAAARLDVPAIRLLLARGADVEATDHTYQRAGEHLPERTVANHEAWDVANALLNPAPR
jgi:ankyrin repeat protein